MQLLLDDTNNDIICLQETWFTKQDLQHLNDVHPYFHGTGVSTVDSRDGPIYGHPPPQVECVLCGEVNSIIALLPLSLI